MLDLTHRRTRMCFIRGLEWLKTREGVFTANKLVLRGALGNRMLYRHMKTALRVVVPQVGNQPGQYEVINQRLDYFEELLRDSAAAYHERRQVDEHHHECLARKDGKTEEELAHRPHQEILHICPHCLKKGKGSVMFRHHFDRCRFRTP